MQQLCRTAIVAVMLAWMPMVSAPAAAADRGFVAIGTGGPTGVYFVAGNSICRLVHQSTIAGQKDRKGLRCAAPSSDGSMFNLRSLRGGDLDFAVVQSDWQSHAYHGSGSFEGNPFEKLRAVFSMHQEPFHIVVAKNSGIRSWADLRGKRVNIGNPGSGQRGTMEVLMAAHGTTVDDFGDATELTSAEQTRALCDGSIDAFAYTVGVPNSSVAVATEGCGARIINLGGPEVRKLIDENPFYRTVSIPRGTYATSVADITTFGVTATLVTRADQPDDVVYALVRAVFENLDDFRKFDRAFADLDPSEMISSGLSAPLHPGAARYYREKGWM